MSVPHPEVCVGAVALHRGRLLMVRRGRGVAAGEWSIPGGRVEMGETLAGAVVREVFEETGLEGICGALAGWVERIDSDFHQVILDFHTEVHEPEPLVAADDALEARWVPLTEVSELHLVSGLAAVLSDNGCIELIV